jgi:hypothetical protein
MSQPFVKFVAKTLMYTLFVIFIVASTVQYPVLETESIRFSDVYKNFTNNFSEYVSRHDLKYTFFENDFFFRASDPTALDLLVSVWVIGNFKRKKKKRCVS